jgi:hypothetical protein
MKPNTSLDVALVVANFFFLSEAVAIHSYEEASCYTTSPEFTCQEPHPEFICCPFGPTRSTATLAVLWERLPEGADATWFKPATDSGGNHIYCGEI